MSSPIESAVVPLSEYQVYLTTVLRQRFPQYPIHIVWSHSRDMYKVYVFNVEHKDRDNVFDAIVELETPECTLLPMIKDPETTARYYKDEVELIA